MTALLEVDDLVGGYGATRILHGLSIAVQAGGATALLGANGAGKTTLMKTLCGLLPAASGRIRWRGDDITRASCAERVRAGLVLVPEGRMVFPGLSVRDNLRLGGVNARARPNWRAGSSASTTCFRSCATATTSSRRRCPAASSRCSRSAAA